MDDIFYEWLNNWNFIDNLCATIILTRILSIFL